MEYQFDSCIFIRNALILCLRHEYAQTNIHFIYIDAKSIGFHIEFKAHYKRLDANADYVRTFKILQYGRNSEIINKRHFVISCEYDRTIGSLLMLYTSCTCFNRYVRKVVIISRIWLFCMLWLRRTNKLHMHMHSSIQTAIQSSIHSFKYWPMNTHARKQGRDRKLERQRCL